MPTVYVLRSSEGLQYIGCTSNLEQRLVAHNHPGNKGWTARGSDWRPVHTQEFATMQEARKRERWLKTGAGRDFLKSIL